MISAQDVKNRIPITVALILATIMMTLDSTIANVALPHIQGSVSASQEEITWAKEFFAEYERDGGEIRNGSDLPRIARATKIIDLARSYGIEVSDFDDQAAHVAAPSDTYHY